MTLVYLLDDAEARTSVRVVCDEHGRRRSAIDDFDKQNLMVIYLLISTLIL